MLGRRVSPAGCLARWLAAVAAGGLMAAGWPAACQTASPAGDDDINPDRPGIADGSQVIGPGRFQVEAGLQAEFRRDGDARERTLFLPTLLRLGIDEAWELRLETSGYVWDRVQGPGSAAATSEGASPVSLGVKYHFLDSAGPQRPSMGVILRVFPASGSGPFRTEHTTADLRLVADWDLAPKWSLNPNVGVALYESGGRTFEAALVAATLGYNPTPALNLFVDTGVQSPEARRGRTSVIFDAGAAYVIGHDLQVDVSVGAGAAGETPPHPFVSAGISKRF